MEQVEGEMGMVAMHCMNNTKPHYVSHCCSEVAEACTWKWWTRLESLR